MFCKVFIGGVALAAFVLIHEHVGDKELDIARGMDAFLVGAIITASCYAVNDMV